MSISCAESEIHERLVVGNCVASGVCHFLEQQKEAVCAINFATALEGEQSAGTMIMRSPNPRGTQIAETLDKAGAVHHVGKEEGAIGHVTKTRIASALGRRHTPLAYLY